MELSVFLAKVFGWYLIIIGLFVLLRKDLMISLTKDILAKRVFIFLIAIFTLPLGLLLVVSHNVWTMGWPVIITVIGWLILFSSVMRLFFPDQVSNKGKAWLKNPSSLTIFAVLYLVIGGYLLFKTYYV